MEITGESVLWILGTIGLIVWIHGWARRRKTYLHGKPFIERDEDGFITEESRKSHIYIQNGCLHSPMMYTRKFHNQLEAVKKIRLNKPFDL
jgi:hypothetical protein